MAKQAVEKILPNLQIDEQVQLHQTGWVVQRIGWVVIFLLPLLGAFGMFGEGMISSRQEEKGGVSVEYDRFYRYEKEMQIDLTSARHMAQVGFPQQYLKHFRIVRIIPEPEQQLASSGNIVFRFSGTDNRHISVYAVPETYGSLRGSVVVNNQVFSIHHFIFP
ncbi:MAG: hypothetical protein ACO1NX_05875 [Chitinophagaceae bacterium]